MCCHHSLEANVPGIQNVDFLIALCLMLGAILYTSVGHAGSSVYIAIMSLFGVPAQVIKPTALVLNIIVSSYTSIRYISAKLFDLKLYIPLAVGAIPMSFLGGSIDLPSNVYKPIVGAILFFAGIMFVFQLNPQGTKEPKHPPVAIAVLAGAVIGFLSGLTGTGGGIFLSPLIIFFAWTTVKGASGTAALFILTNSVFGLLGHISSVSELPDALWLYAIAVIIGALIGTRLGIKQFSNDMVKRALGAVLLIAGAKLMFNL
jgi:uncharacterized membrane protein YfcA